MTSKPLQLKFKKKPVTKTRLIFKQKNKENLKIRLIKKDRNSPLLSISNYLLEYLKFHQITTKLDFSKLWQKYQKSSSNSLIIKYHHIDFNIFTEIAEQILQTYRNKINIKARHSKKELISLII